MKGKERPIKVHQSCPDCGHNGCLSVWETTTYCHSCGVSKYLLTNAENASLYTKEDREVHLMEDTSNSIGNSNSTNPSTIEGTFQVFRYRNIEPSTLKKFNTSILVDTEGKPRQVHYRYPSGASKVRVLEPKNFYTAGEMGDKPLFGADVFPPASAPCIVITEGENDAMACWQMLGGKYPCVSPRSASCAVGDIGKMRNYVNSFHKIYLCFDDDAPGQKAAGEVAKLFDLNKVYHFPMGGGLKDAQAYLEGGRQEEFLKTFWNSKIRMPKGIINSYADIEKLLAENDNVSVASFPFPTLDAMSYGFRWGEVYLFTAPEKVGKTEVIRAIEAHLLKTTDYNLGIIHLEEKEKRSVNGLVSYQLGKPAHLPDSGLSREEILRAYKDLTKRDGRVHFYTHFGSNDPDVILDVVRTLVTVCGCKFVFLDHITMIVTGYDGDDERRKLDYISTRLAMLTRELEFALILVSHVNDLGQTRGSRNIAKIADLIVSLERNIEADSYDGRNTTKLTVKGNRFASESGPAGYLWFDRQSYTVSEKELNDQAQPLPF